MHSVRKAFLIYFFINDLKFLPYGHAKKHLECEEIGKKIKVKIKVNLKWKSEAVFSIFKEESSTTLVRESLSAKVMNKEFKLIPNWWFLLALDAAILCKNKWIKN